METYYDYGILAQGNFVLIYVDLQPIIGEICELTIEGEASVNFTTDYPRYSRIPYNEICHLPLSEKVLSKFSKCFYIEKDDNGGVFYVFKSDVFTRPDNYIAIKLYNDEQDSGALVMIQGYNSKAQFCKGEYNLKDVAQLQNLLGALDFEEELELDSYSYYNTCL